MFVYSYSGGADERGPESFPDFDATRYERPNQNWVCGNARRLPLPDRPAVRRLSRDDRVPAVRRSAGEAKGTWKCVRPKTGAAPVSGARPDGTVARPSALSAGPQPSRAPRAGDPRGRRRLCRPAAPRPGRPLRGWLLSPALSLRHSGPEFARLAARHAGLPADAASADCVACHRRRRPGLRLMPARFTRAMPRSRFDKFVTRRPRFFPHGRRLCDLHTTSAFTRRNVARDTSCVGLPSRAPGSRPHARGASKTAWTAMVTRPDARAAGRAMRCRRAVCQGGRARVIVHAVARPPPAYGGYPPLRPPPRVPGFARVAEGHQHPPLNHQLHSPATPSPVETASRSSAPPATSPTPRARSCSASRLSKLRVCHSLNFDDSAPGLQLRTRRASARLPAQPAGPIADYGRRRLGLATERRWTPM